MKSTLLLALLGASVANALHVEISKQNIIDKLSGESQFFSGLMNPKWTELGHTDSFALDFKTLQLSAPENHDHKAVDYTVQGKAGSQAFTAVAHIALVNSPPYGNYKHRFEQSVSVSGVADTKLAADI